MIFYLVWCIWKCLLLFLVCFSSPAVVEAIYMESRHSPLKEACRFLWAASTLPSRIRRLASSDMQIFNGFV